MELPRPRRFTDGKDAPRIKVQGSSTDRLFIRPSLWPLSRRARPNLHLIRFLGEFPFASPAFLRVLRPASLVKAPLRCLPTPALPLQHIYGLQKPEAASGRALRVLAGHPFATVRSIAPYHRVQYGQAVHPLGRLKGSFGGLHTACKFVAGLFPSGGTSDAPPLAMPNCLTLYGCLEPLGEA